MGCWIGEALTRVGVDSLTGDSVCTRESILTGVDSLIGSEIGEAEARIGTEVTSVISSSSSLTNILRV